MIFIKRFNESLGEFDNQILTPNEFIIIRQEINLKFDVSEKEEIKKFFGQYKSIPRDYVDNIWDNEGRKKIIPRLFGSASGRGISIYKINDDEWYLLHIYKISGINQYWKCDGLDGLFDILEKDMIRLKKVPSSEFLDMVKSQEESKTRKNNIIKKIRQFSEEDWNRLSGIIDNW